MAGGLHGDDLGDLPEQIAPPEPSLPPAAAPVRQPAKAKPPKHTRKAPMPAPQQPAAKAPSKAQASAKAAPVAGGGAPQKAVAAGAVQSWQAAAGARISRHMQRTRLAGRGATLRVQIAVSVAADGRATARLVGSTGEARMDAALARQAARMPHLAPPPGGKAQSFILPIKVRF